MRPRCIACTSTGLRRGERRGLPRPVVYTACEHVAGTRCWLWQHSKGRFQQSEGLCTPCSAGVTAQPNDFSQFDITVAADDDSAPVSLTQNVDGNAGAKWYGFYGGALGACAVAALHVMQPACPEVHAFCTNPTASWLAVNGAKLTTVTISSGVDYAIAQLVISTTTPPAGCSE